MKKIIWIGNIVNPIEVNNYKAVSPAANVWQLGFIEGLLENDIEVAMISTVPYSTWPKGPFWAGKPSLKLTNDNVQQYFLGYLNILFIREIWIAIHIVFLSMFQSKLKEANSVITYNPLVRHCLSAAILKNIFKKKWISILADEIVKGKPDLTLFLSYDYFKRFNNGKKYFLDGGVENITPSKSEGDERRVIVYAGSQSNVTGIFEFVQLFDSLKDDRYELHIYGKGNDNRIVAISKQNPKIKLQGFASDETLYEACSNAFAFINPRPLSSIANNTFPSKLLYYIKFEKPIISTETLAVSPKYNQLLFKYNLNDDKSLLACLNSLDKIDSLKYSKIAEEFKKENSWYNLVKGFVKYAST